MKNLEKIQSISIISCPETHHISGGEEVPTATSSLWNDLGYYASQAVKAAIIFSQEGGRNAGMVVR